MTTRLPEETRPDHAEARSGGVEGSEVGLANAMRRRTTQLHAHAERSGIVGAILSSRVTRGGYALFLRNLAPAYEALEGALARGETPIAKGLDRPELRRAGALARDLTELAGAEWASRLPLLPEGEAYAARVAAAAGGDGARLIAHAYARYLGDLAGGRFLRRSLAASLGLPPSALSFYDFPAIAEPTPFARAYRAGIDALGATLADATPVIEEAAVAFERNIALSEAVLALGAGDAEGGPLTIRAETTIRVSDS